MNVDNLWWVAIRLAGGTAGGLVLGLILGNRTEGLALAFGAMLARELWQLRRTHQWLRGDRIDLAPDVDGSWGELVGMVARLHRRKQYHKRRLLRLLREFRRSTAAIPDGVVVLNAQAEILWFNRMAARLLQLRARSDVGLRIENLVRQPEFIAYLRGGDYALPVTVRAASAMELYLQIQVVPYGDGQLMMLVRDVTRQQRLEAMRKDFVANASHELRSPLTVIAGYLETLAQDPQLDPQLAGPFEEMRRQSSRMTHIIEDLLVLSKLEADDGLVEGTAVDVATLLGQLRRDLLARLPHPLDVHLDLQGPQRLLGDEPQIHSAFSNLLDNAAKYTPAGGTITLRWSTDAQGACLAVQDTGIGISAEHIPRLTERFYRVDAGRSRATGGSGLGLAIVKHVMQRHGGSLEITSQEGQGSTFACHFPPARVLAASGPVAH